MIERRGGSSFLRKTLQALSIGRKGFRQHLNRDRTIEPRIVGAIDLAHTAGTDQRLDFVRPELGSGSERHRARLYATGGKGQKGVVGRVEKLSHEGHEVTRRKTHENQAFVMPRVLRG